MLEQLLPLDTQEAWIGELVPSGVNSEGGKSSGFGFEYNELESSDMYNDEDADDDDVLNGATR